MRFLCGFKCVRIQRRLCTAIVFPFAFIWLVFLYQYSQLPRDLHAYLALMSLAKATGDVCHIPRLDPYDNSILSYIEKSTPVVCKQIQPVIVFLDTDNSELVINETALAVNGYSFDAVRCSYRCFYHNTGISDDSVRFDPWSELKSLSQKVVCEFVEVSCSKNTLLGQSIQIYSDHFAQIIVKEKHASKENERLSVLVFGIDSMSRSNFQRQLPKTLSFLMSDLAAFPMNGFTKVGDNTWINSIAMLTGKLVQNTKEFASELDDSNYARVFDNWANYVWKNFSAQGYVTYFSEDRPDIANFNYAPKRGFQFPPTDHYSRPFWIAFWWSFVHRRSSAFCYNTKPEHLIQLNQLKDFLKKYNSQPYFAWYWTQNLSHDLLNKIGAADNDFEAFFLQMSSYLNNTVLLVLSDHGHRYDSIRQSVVGRLEARMPFLAVVLPPWFQRKYTKIVRNMQENGSRLTSMFDVYATFADILKSTQSFREANEDIKDQRKPLTNGGLVDGVSGAGLSLFRPISAERRCFDAKIPEEYCPCYQELPLPTSDAKVQRLSLHLVDHVNRLLSKFIIDNDRLIGQPKCAKLKLKLVRDAFIFVPTEKVLRDPQVANRLTVPRSLRYRLQVAVEPSDALLEAVVKHELDADRLTVDGDVDRNNAYGNTSACITDAKLRKYCYCLTQ